MKVNKVYAEEIAKWEGAKSWSGDKATKPFAVLWDDPESGAARVAGIGGDFGRESSQGNVARAFFKIA